MKSKRILLLLAIVSLLLAGCAKRYTEEQVNQTVVVKIKEMAGLQKVNVTVETVIVKEYIVVPTTAEPGDIPLPAPFSSPTPLPFAQLKAEDVYDALGKAGFTVRRFYYEVPDEELGPMKQFISQAYPVNLISDNIEYQAVLYDFAAQDLKQKGYDYLTAEKPGVSNDRVLSVRNLMLELETDMPLLLVEKVKEALSGLA